MNTNSWLTTPKAAEALGRSGSYLKRLRETHGGFLEAGIHYSLAPSHNAPITWNVPLVRDAINQRGLDARGYLSVTSKATKNNDKQSVPTQTMARLSSEGISIILENNYGTLVCVNFNTDANSLKKIADLLDNYPSNPSQEISNAQFLPQAIGQTLELVICEK